ncbi:uncharacterized protein LOC120780116 [Bactrocera tryoni]|uniref:uncharacterized protein LOC120780116 n=1 Tax=Bactrocera tryoni TaxID=59916 RepID=UPI001A967848|nr:uncharacterized protein LOC120780116 [Bactrocera tryoni]
MNSDDEVFEGIMDNVIDETISSTPSKSKRRKKPQIVSSWTNESTTNLIQAIEMYNCIWEYSCPEYKDRAKRDKAWNNIAEKFPTQEVDGSKAKWANIKTAFSNVKKKLQLNPAKRPVKLCHIDRFGQLCNSTVCMIAARVVRPSQH